MLVTIPAKTFLLGEYLSLIGGPTLIACTTPTFCVTITPHSSCKLSNIHWQSPAGKFIAHYQDHFQNSHIVFDDPYHAAGGLGASSAQFLGCYYAWHYLQDTRWQFSAADIPELLALYQQFTAADQGISPSGADVIAQTQQQICFFHRNVHQLTTYPWPFADLSFCFIRTGIKVATHQHLHHLTTLPTAAPLEAIVLDAQQSLIDQNPHAFITAINSYAEQLAQHDLTHPKTLELLQQLRQHPACLAAKGCGALGADIIAVVIKCTHYPKFRTWLQQMQLPFVANEQQLVVR